MISSLAIQVVKGAIKKIETIKYRSGKIVKRIYPSVDSTVPEDIEFLAPETAVTIAR